MGAVLLAERLDPAELTAVAEAFARTSDGWRHQVRFDERQPFRTLLHVDERVDIWLHTWLPGQVSELGSPEGGESIAVVDGRLDEWRLSRRGRRVHRRHRVGRPFWVAPGTRHVLRNRTKFAAISIHAYSPSLLRASFDIDAPVAHAPVARFASAAS